MKKSPPLISKFLMHAPPDLCLITDQNGTKKFFVHKVILMCISPYFQKVIQYKNGLISKRSVCDCKANEAANGSPLPSTSTGVIGSTESSTPKSPALTTEALSTKSPPNEDENSEKRLIRACKEANKTVEKGFLTLRLPGISDKVLSVIINYAYNGKIRLNCENVQDLIVACDMYNIPALVAACTNFLTQHLAVANVIGIYQFAKEYSFSKLADQAKRFVLRNYETVYESSDEFVQLLTAADLLYLVEQNLLYVADEYFVFKSIVKWIQFDEEARKPFFGELIQKVRLALISNERLQNQMLNHQLVSADSNVRSIVLEVVKLKKYLDTWGKPNYQMLNSSIKKYLAPRYPLDLVFVFGGRVLDVEFVTPETMVEVYDHRAERWKRIAFAEDPAGPRDHHQAVVVKSNIYIIGGHRGPFNVYNSCRKFNLTSKTWSEIAPMNEKRTFLASAVIDDTVYAIGGFNGSWRVNTVERYNIALNQWQLVTSMNERRSGAGASVLNKKIYVVGGFRNLTYLRCAEFYDPLTNLWTNIAQMTKPRSNPCVVTLNGFIYAIGGLANQKLLSSAEKYDSVTNSWTMLEEEMFEKKCSAAAVVLEDKIYVIGGWNGIVGLHTVEIWCSQTKRWYQGSKLQKRRTGCSACLVKDVANVADYGIIERENLIDERYRNAYETEN